MTDPIDPLRAQREHGVEAENQEFRRYEQVNKQQSYRLAEGGDEELFDDDFELSTCDMRDFLDGGAAGKDRFAKQLGTALEDIGFAILIGHGIDADHYRDIDRLTLAFFEEASEAQREPYLAKRHGSVNQGYFPLKTTSNIHPDLVLGWVFCRRAFDMDGDSDYDAKEFWPNPEFEPVFRRHCERHQQLFLPIMQSVLRYLGCDPHLYDRKLTATNFGFRLNYYPPIEVDSSEKGGRMLGHEDVDLFTLLPAPAVDGLQALHRASNKWVRLSAPPGSIILNVGDYLQRISNDRLPSTTHRVAQSRQAGSLHAYRHRWPCTCGRMKCSKCYLVLASQSTSRSRR